MTTVTVSLCRHYNSRGKESLEEMPKQERLEASSKNRHIWYRCDML